MVIYDLVGSRTGDKTLLLIAGSLCFNVCTLACHCPRLHHALACGSCIEHYHRHSRAHIRPCVTCSVHAPFTGPGSEDVAKTVPTWQLREISSHPSYHGAINKEKAEHKLSKKDRTCFLTRYSEARDQYTLSVHTKGKETVFQNFDIIITNKDGCVAYEISGTEEKFTSLVKLLDFYKEYPLNHYIHSIGEELVNNKRGSSTSRVTEPVIAESSKSIAKCDGNI